MNLMELDYSKPPKNVFDAPNLCPNCGGLGFICGPGGIYLDCPNPQCKNGKIDERKPNKSHH